MSLSQLTLTGMLTAGLVAPLAAAELYTWKDANGRVHFSDTAPASSTRGVQTQRLPSSPAAQPAPSSRDTAADQHIPDPPRVRVALYSGDCGRPCEQASQLLAGWRVSYGTAFPEESPAALAELEHHTSGRHVIPVLMVGEQALVGFHALAWEQALATAGFTRNSYPAPYRESAVEISSGHQATPRRLPALPPRSTAHP